ncbi:hypothetical protein EV363DRAFT_1299302 [Boletus edulis]|nr:hypothetical protein EV363DRAFT_1299302 [Boletus edulis]
MTKLHGNESMSNLLKRPGRTKLEGKDVPVLRVGLEGPEQYQGGLRDLAVCFVRAMGGENGENENEWVHASRICPFLTHQPALVDSRRQLGVYIVSSRPYFRVLARPIHCVLATVYSASVCPRDRTSESSAARFIHCVLATVYSASVCPRDRTSESSAARFIHCVLATVYFASAARFIHCVLATVYSASVCPRDRTSESSAARFIHCVLATVYFASAAVVIHCVLATPCFRVLVPVGEDKIDIVMQHLQLGIKRL